MASRGLRSRAGVAIHGTSKAFVELCRGLGASTLGRPRDSCEAVVRAPPGKWAVFAFLCGDGLEGWRHLGGDEERGAPQTRHLIGRRQPGERGEKSRMRRRTADGAQRAWANPDPASGLGGELRLMCAVSRGKRAARGQGENPCLEWCAERLAARARGPGGGKPLRCGRRDTPLI